MNIDEELIKLLPDSLVTSIISKEVINTFENIDRSAEGVCEEIFVVARSMHAYSIDYGFGQHFRLLVAIGGLISNNSGFLKAGKEFVTLYLTNQFELITFDVHGSDY